MAKAYPDQKVTVTLELSEESYRALLRLYHVLGDTLIALKPASDEGQVS